MPPKAYSDWVIEVAKAAADYTGVDHEPLLEGSRKHCYSLARAIVFRILVEHGASTTVIGYVLKKDHSAVVKQKRECSDADVAAVREKINHLSPPPPWVPARRRALPIKHIGCPKCREQGTARIDTEQPTRPKYCIKCNYEWPSKPTPAFTDRA